MGFGGSRKDKSALDLEALTTLTADDILALSGGITVNEGAEDVDFRVESQTNTHALIVDASSSKVGINKSVPHLPLHVVKTATSGAGAYANTPCMILEDATRPGLQLVGNASNIGIIQFGDNSSSNPGEIYYDHGANSFSFRTAGSVSLTLDSDGKLGIGTTSPGVDLEVQDTTTSSASQGGNLRLSANDGAVMASGHRLGVLEFAGAEDTSNTITVGARIEALCDATWSASENGADLLFYTTDGNASQSEQMRILADGKVGIGVADPDSALEVLQGSGNQLKLSYDGSNSVAFAVSSGGTMTITPSGGKVYTSMLGHKKLTNAAISHASGPATTISGSVIFQTGNATPSSHIVGLPATAAGVMYTFIFAGTATEGFHISPNASDKFMGHVIKVNGDLLEADSNGAGVDNKDLILGTSSNVGDRVTIVGDGSAGWYILDAVGDWSFQS